VQCAFGGGTWWGRGACGSGRRSMASWTSQEPCGGKRVGRAGGNGSPTGTWGCLGPLRIKWGWACAWHPSMSCTWGKAEAAELGEVKRLEGTGGAWVYTTKRTELCGTT
jgi:hypothetical protein